jgi:hypothetical protein
MSPDRSAALLTVPNELAVALSKGERFVDPEEFSAGS